MSFIAQQSLFLRQTLIPLINEKLHLLLCSTFSVMVHVDEEGDTESLELHLFTPFEKATFMKMRKVEIVYRAHL